VELDAGHTADRRLLKPTADVQAAVVVLQCVPSQCRVQGARCMFSVCCSMRLLVKHHLSGTWLCEVR
jgi:hypothetical protein